MNTTNMTKKILIITSVFPYLFASILFILLTFPGSKFFNIHVEAGYLKFTIIGLISIFIIHFGSISILKKYLCKDADKESRLMLIERFNLILGMGIVIFFDGLFGDCFHYRSWAYGVNKAESVIEKLEDNWNEKKLSISIKEAPSLGKNIDVYTNTLNSKWENYRRK